MLRLSAIGDVSHVVPLVRTLQRHWPQCRLTWVVGRTEYGLVGGLEGVEFIVVDKGEGLIGAARRLRRTLAGRRFEVLLHLQASWRANLLASVISAERRVGFDRARACNGQGWFIDTPLVGPSRVHVLDGFFQFLEVLGLNARELRWQIPVPEAAKLRVEAQVAAAEPFLAISPCSSIRARNFRNWSPQRYAAVADHAYRQRGLSLVLTGGPTEQERAYAQAITAACRAAPVIDLIGQTTLPELLAVLTRACAFVGPDSGPLHLANAVATPVVGLYATSNPQRTGPYCFLDSVADRYPEAIYAAYGRPVSELRWGQRVRQADAMERITVHDVTARLDALLSNSV
nr:glycosyltransferase family 9 protein [Halorhodospira abdelmalekii]